MNSFRSYVEAVLGLLYRKATNMCKEQDELIAIVDEIAGAAVSMNQGAQSYDCFIKARDRYIKKINDSFVHKNKLTEAIQNLHKLI